MVNHNLVLTILIITMTFNVIVSYHYVHSESKRIKHRKPFGGME